MAAFSYIALDVKGRRRKGVIEAESPRQARHQLRQNALTALSVAATSKSQQETGAATPAIFSNNNSRIGLRDLSLITQQLASMVQAGVTIEQALQALIRQDKRAPVKSVLAAVRAHVMEGHSLAEGFRLYPRVFSDLFCTSVQAGEQSGHLGKVLTHLAEFSEQSYALRQKILLALLYPAVLTVASLLIIIFLTAFIVPDMVKIFADGGHTLPFLTRALIGGSHFMGHYGLLLLLALTGLCFYARRLLLLPAVRLKFDKKILAWPLAGSLIIQYSAARFSSTLGILQSSGVPLIHALDISGAVMANRHIRVCIQDIAKNVREGISLSRAMERSDVFPPIVIAMTSSGEVSGEMDQMLVKVGALIQRDMQGRIAVLLGLFEPLVLLVMGGIVLLLVLAIILPTLDLNQMVK